PGDGGRPIPLQRRAEGAAEPERPLVRPGGRRDARSDGADPPSGLSERGSRESAGSVRPHRNRRDPAPAEPDALRRGEGRDPPGRRKGAGAPGAGGSPFARRTACPARPQAGNKTDGLFCSRGSRAPPAGGEGGHPGSRARRKGSDGRLPGGGPGGQTLRGCDGRRRSRKGSRGSRISGTSLLLPAGRGGTAVSGPRLLVAGVGNVFFGDDGFGVEVVRRLAGRGLPDGAEVRDFGIRGFDLALALSSGWDAAVLVDASRRGGAPGTVY